MRDRAVAPPVGTYPTWKLNVNYVGGDKVLYGGFGYIAKWDN